MGFQGVVMKFENGLEVGYNKAVKAPSSYKVQTSDIDLDSKRSMSGYLTRNRTRGGKTAAYTVTVSWDRLTWDELQSLIAAGEAPKFTLKLLDPKVKGGYTTKTMYRQADMEYEMINIYEDGEAYWTTTMSFIEF